MTALTSKPVDDTGEASSNVNSPQPDAKADAILAIEVELSNPGPGEAQIFWAGRWQRFSTRRMERATSGRHRSAPR